MVNPQDSPVERKSKSEIYAAEMKLRKVCKQIGVGFEVEDQACRLLFWFEVADYLAANGLGLRDLSMHAVLLLMLSSGDGREAVWLAAEELVSWRQGGVEKRKGEDLNVDTH